VKAIRLSRHALGIDNMQLGRSYMFEYCPSGKFELSQNQEKRDPTERHAVFDQWCLLKKGSTLRVDRSR